MTTTINKFSIARLALIIRRDAALNWKTHLAHFLELAGAMLAGLLVIMLSGGSFNIIADSFYSWFSMILSVGCLIAASSMMKPISGKTGSIDYLSLPATNAEKFVARALIVTVGFTLSAFVALIAVGVLYYLLVALFGLDAYGSLTWYCTKSFFAPPFHRVTTSVALEREVISAAWNWQGQMMAWGWMLFGQSVFVLGSALWRKFAFVKTLGASIALGIVASFVLAFSWHPDSREAFAESFPVLLATMGSIFITLAVVDWVVAYRLFVRKQVVEIKKRAL